MSGRVGPLKPLTPPFINTYSMDFDGVDDYISVTANPLTDFTVSFWIKPSSGVGASYDGILGQGTTSAQGGILRYVAYDGTGTLGNVLVFLATWTNVSGTVTNGVWTNIILTYDSTLDELKSYNNGSLYTTISSPNFSAQTTNAHSFERIGLRNGLSGTEFNGNIDEVALWNSALTDISSIYNGGTPADLSLLPTPPVNWYRMGDNGSYKSPQWLLPNNENKDKVSNYSFDFDGVDDFVDVGSLSTLQNATEFSVSSWFKTPLAALQGVWVWFDGADGWLELNCSADGSMVANVTRLGSATYGIAAAGTLTSDTWYNATVIFNGGGATNADRLKLYVNGNPITLTFIGTIPTQTGTMLSGELHIGERYNGVNYFNGNIDEVSIFDSAISIGDVWDGSGEPTTISGAIAHWRMGEDATFSGGVWTVPDQVGSNDGTSANMTIEDRVGSAPSSSINTVSFNMDLIDRVEDTP